MYRPNRIARLISAAYRHQLAYLSRNLTPYHLGGGSYIYLLLIVENPGISQAEFTSRLLIDRATVSKMLAYLEREKMIVRTSHAKDRRQAILNPTPLGVATYQNMRTITADYREIMLNGISREDQAVTIRTLQKVMKNLQQANKQDKRQK